MSLAWFEHAEVVSNSGSSEEVCGDADVVEMVRC